MQAIKTAGMPYDMRFRAYCSPFGLRSEHRVMVRLDGSVPVYDDIAEHYTTCHSLSSDDTRKLQLMAVRYAAQVRA